MKIRTTAIALALLLLVGIDIVGAEEIRGKVSLGDLKAPDTATTVAKVVDAATLEITSSSLARGKKFKVILPESQPSLILVSLNAPRNKFRATGVSRLVGVGAELSSKFSIRLKKRSRKKLGTVAPNMLPSSALDAGKLAYTAVKGSNITVSGRGTTSAMSDMFADVLGTSLANADCYRKDEGFVIVETDPRALAAVQAELDLCNSGAADPSSCFPNNRRSPDHFVKGTVLSSGGVLMVAIGLVAPDSSILASVSDTAPVSQFISLAERVGANLGQSICIARQMRLTINARRGDCDWGECNRGGTEIGTSFEADFDLTVKGPVGSMLTFAENSGFSVSNLLCRNWSEKDCAGKKCCEREFSSQPAEVNLIGSIVSRGPDGFECLIPPLASLQIGVSAELTAGTKVLMKSVDLMCQ